MCLVLKQRIRTHLLNASRQRHSSDDDEDTLGFVGDIDAVCMYLLSNTSLRHGDNKITSFCLSIVLPFC